MAHAGGVRCGGQYVSGEATLFNKLTHWGHADVYEHHLSHDVRQCDMDVQPTNIQVGTGVVLRFRMLWDAGHLS